MLFANSKTVTAARVLWKRAVLERSRRWTRADLESRQARALAYLRRFTHERSPFYRRFHRGLETAPLTALPVLSKAEMMENFNDVMTDRRIRLADVELFLRSDPGERLYVDRYVALATSGSTGLRGVFLFNQHEWLTALANIARPIAWAGVKPNLVRPARTAMLASTTPWHYSSRVGLSLSSRLIPTLRFDAAEPIDSVVARLNEWQPEVLAVYPSVLRQLAEEQIAGRLRIRLRHVSTSAEVLTPGTRRRVREAWNIAVYDTYGATEYAPIAAECAYGRKHLLEDQAIIEVADERGPVPPGETGNRVLLTILGRFTQPLIRYEISDMVRLTDGGCECGRPFRLVAAVEGRQEDVLHFPARASLARSITVHPNAFHNLLESVAASGWQVIQQPDALNVYFTGLRDPGAGPRVENAIAEFLFREGAVLPPIRVTEVAMLQRGATGKAPLVLASAPRAEAAPRMEPA